MTKIKTIAQLIDMKEKIGKKKNEIKEFYVDSLETTFKYKTATRAEMLRFDDMEKSDVDPYNIFSHVIEPDLKAKELQDAYNSGEKPYMIVDKLLEPMEVVRLSASIVGKEIQGENLTKKIKN